MHVFDPRPRVNSQPLHRNKFVANYFNGTKEFVEDNAELIKRGAGLLALRAWLLVSDALSEGQEVMTCPF